MEFCANPSYNKAFWIVKNKVYFPGDAENGMLAYDITNTSTPNCHQAVLYMNEVSNDDVGEYSLIIRSPNGLSEGVFTVNMTYASGYNVQTPPSCSNRNTFTTDHCAHVIVLIVLRKLFIE